MVDMLVASVVLLWLLVIVLAVAVVALARQVGLLHARINPAGALTPTDGPKVGERTEPLEAPTLADATVTIGGPGAGARLVLFVSPTCPVCRQLVPVARRLARQEGLDLVFASDGDTLPPHRAYAEALDIEPARYLLSQPLGLRYGVSKLPFALLIGADGTLLGKGLVNTREHLESLLESAESGIRSLQDYVRRFDPAQAEPEDAPVTPTGHT